MQAKGELPPLQGSDKQIAWAQDIRAKSVQALAGELAERLGLALPTRQNAAPWLEEAAKRLCARQPPQASWWIDRRKSVLSLLLGELERETAPFAAAYQAHLLASIHAHAGALHRNVPAALDRLSLDQLADEEARLLRLAGIHRQGEALGSAWSSAVAETSPAQDRRLAHAVTEQGGATRRGQGSLGEWIGAEDERFVRVARAFRLFGLPPPTTTEDGGTGAYASEIASQYFPRLSERKALAIIHFGLSTSHELLLLHRPGELRLEDLPS